MNEQNGSMRRAAAQLVDCMDCWFEPYPRHCVMTLNKTLYPLLSTGSTLERSNTNEKLLTETYSINTNKNAGQCMIPCYCTNTYDKNAPLARMNSSFLSMVHCRATKCSLHNMLLRGAYFVGSILRFYSAFLPL